MDKKRDQKETPLWSGVLLMNGEQLSLRNVELELSLTPLGTIRLILSGSGTDILLALHPTDYMHLSKDSRIQHYLDTIEAELD